jgi:two-component system, NarL family, sensor histidine kinase DesK
MLGHVRESSDLAPTAIRIGGYRSQGLVAELDLARCTLDAAGVTLTWQPPPAGAPVLSATEETVLSLSVREAVTNIVQPPATKLSS